MTRPLGVGELGRVRLVREAATSTTASWGATARVGLGHLGTSHISAAGATGEDAERILRTMVASAEANARRLRGGRRLTFADWAHSWLDLRTVPRAWRPTYAGALGGSDAPAQCERAVLDTILVPALGNLRDLSTIKAEAHVVDVLSDIAQTGIALPALLGPTMGTLWAANDCRPRRGGPMLAFYDAHIDDRWMPPGAVPPLLARLALDDGSSRLDLVAVAVACIASFAPVDQVLATRARDIDLQDPPHTLVLDERLVETDDPDDYAPTIQRDIWPGTCPGTILRTTDLDFGECRRVALPHSVATVLTTRLGSLQWLAPEVLIFRDDHDDPVAPDLVETWLRDAVRSAEDMNGFELADLRSAALLHLATRTSLGTAVAFAKGRTSSAVGGFGSLPSPGNVPPETWLDGLLQH